MSQAKVLLLDENRGFGGAERHVITLGQELRERGSLASLVGRKDSWLYKEAVKTSLPFSPCGFRNEVDMFSVFAIYKMVKSTEANVLHCIAHRDLVAAALARQLPGAPHTVLIKAEHSFPDDDLSPLFRWAYRQCDGLASVSEAMQRALWEKLQTETPWDCEFQVIANGIDLRPEPSPRPARAGSASPENQGFPGREATRATEDRYRIGVLSALREGKGHRDFLHALAQSSPALREKVEVSIAGDGPLREELETLSRELGVPVTFHGHMDEPAIYLATLDLCVLPSHTETFSLVALESLTMGIPLLAADSDGVAELYPEPEMLFGRGKGSELVSKLERFIDNPAAFSKRAQELSRRYRQDYSREKMGANYERFYDRLLTKVVVPT